MSNTLTLDGTLTCSPQSCGGDGDFPGSNLTTTFCGFTGPSGGSVNVDTGMRTQVVNSPSSYLVITGVGSADTVTQAAFFFIRTRQPMLLRLTYTGLSTPAEEPIRGLKIIEVDPTHPLTKIEVMGTGTIEMFAAGAQ